MAKQRILITHASVQSSGADGGHSYLSGRCEWLGRDVAVTVLMADRLEESRLVDGETWIISSRFEYTGGAGLLVSEARLLENE